MAIIGTIVLAAAVAVILRLPGVTQHNQAAGVAGVAFASAIFMPLTRRWSARAHMCWASSASHLADARRQRGLARVRAVRRQPAWGWPDTTQHARNARINGSA
jgi:hypothetical protein